MKTQTKILIAVGVVGLVAVGTVALAGPAYGGRHERPKLRLGERLGLTEDQRAKVKDVLKAHQTEVRPLVDKVIAERRALRELIHAEKVDEAAIRGQAGKVAGVEADLAVARAKVAQDIRPILSPEQKQRLSELKAEAHEWADEFRERIAKRIAAE
jgi:Spy/CpxP family protein refolding chaperone